MWTCPLCGLKPRNGLEGLISRSMLLWVCLAKVVAAGHTLLEPQSDAPHSNTSDVIASE